MKKINVAKKVNSPRGIKAQTATEKLLAKAVNEKINFDFMVIIEKNNNLYACKMPKERITACICENKGRCKILCPLGKNQVDELIVSGELEKIGESSDLLKYHNNDRYKIKGSNGNGNNGKAIEYYLAQKYHCKFDHTGKMTDGNGEFKGCEVKFFSYDKTSGTPSATFENAKSILK